MTEPLPPSVASDYGLIPIRSRERIQPPIASRDLISDTHYSQGSEYGGVDGLVQPAPHIPTASERLSMVYAIDPTDDGSRADSVKPPELEGNF
jgi:hypothetical protein